VTPRTMLSIWSDVLLWLKGSRHCLPNRYCMVTTAQRSRLQPYWPCSTGWVSSRRTRVHESVMTTPIRSLCFERQSTARSFRQMTLLTLTLHAHGQPPSCIGTTLITDTAVFATSHQRSATREKIKPSWQHATLCTQMPVNSTRHVGQAIRATGLPSVLSRSTPSAIASSSSIRLTTIFSRWLLESGDKYLDVGRSTAASGAGKLNNGSVQVSTILKWTPCSQLLPPAARRVHLALTKDIAKAMLRMGSCCCSN